MKAQVGMNRWATGKQCRFQCELSILKADPEQMTN